MKSIYIFILYLLFAKSIFSQITFSKTYGTSGMEAAENITYTNDNGYIVVGEKEGNIWILKLDQYGDTVWTKTFNVSPCAYSVLQSSNNEYLVASASNDKLILLKLNQNGDSIWSKKYFCSSNGEKTTIIEAQNNEYLLISDKFQIYKINSNGDIIWVKAYLQQNGNYSYDVVKSSDNDYIIVGEGIIGQLSNVIVFKISDLGDSLWTKYYYGGGFHNVAYSINKIAPIGYIIAGTRDWMHLAKDYESRKLWILKIDENGDTLWTKSFSKRGSNWARNAFQTNDNNYFVVGNISSYGDDKTDVWLLKLNGNGDTLWTKNYGGNMEDRSRSGFQTSDGGYIVAGYTRSYGAGAEDIWVLKLDGNGNYNSINEIIYNSEFSVYPNPNDGKFSLIIQNSDCKIQDAKLEITNILGNSILKSQILNHESEINISKYPKGIYFVKATIGNEVFVEKIICQ